MGINLIMFVHLDEYEPTDPQPTDICQMFEIVAL